MHQECSLHVEIKKEVWKSYVWKIKKVKILLEEKRHILRIDQTIGNMDVISQR